MFRILGVVIGTVFGGFGGAILGYIVGSLLETFVFERTAKDKSQAEAYADASSWEGESPRERFMKALLMGMANIICADGRVMHSEMECARNFLRNHFGEEVMREGNLQLLYYIQRYKDDPQAFEWEVTQRLGDLRAVLNDTQLVVLLNFFVSIAQADGAVPESEQNVLQHLATVLGQNPSIIDQLLGLGKDTLDAAYQVLGVPSTATNAELKAAYRKLVVANHPDRVAALGEDIRRAAEEKLQQINAAKEKIWNARGMN